MALTRNRLPGESVVLFAALLASPSAFLFITPSAAALGANGEESPTQTYTGTVVLMNGQRYILRDDENNIWYHLDDQKRAEQFLGKKVTVTGKLDAATDFIHVENIQVQG